MQHYFVDEAGDGNLFNKHGKSIIGTEGCSNYFILGYTYIEDPEAVTITLNSLRTKLLNDPLLKDISSMQLGARKTALLFHAKDDNLHVRYEVLKLIKSMPGIHFHAIVMNKRGILKRALEVSQQNSRYKYDQKEVYDYMAGRILHNNLHRDTNYNICFAKRWKGDQSKALKKALESARGTFMATLGITSNSEIHVSCEDPAKVVPLQVTDYLLWALQRYYERGEKSYIQELWHQYSAVCDDDYSRLPQTSTKWYDKKRPLP